MLARTDSTYQQWVSPAAQVSVPDQVMCPPQSEDLVVGAAGSVPRHQR